MYCRNCGAQISDTANFCNRCGARTGSAGSTAPSYSIPGESTASVRSAPQAAATPVSGPKIYANERFYNGRITVYPDRVVIDRKGIMPMMYRGYSRDTKTIPITSITAIEFKKQGFKPGFIRFSVSGEGRLANTYDYIIADENTVTFLRADQKKALRIKEIVEGLMRQAQQRTTSPVFVSAPAQSSAADELIKLKQLLDTGAITPEEYAAAKRSILGL